MEFINHLSYYYAGSLHHFIDVVCGAGFPESLLSIELTPNKNFSNFVQECKGLALSQRKVIFQALTQDKPNSKAFQLLAESKINNFTDALIAVNDLAYTEVQEEDKSKVFCFNIYIDTGNAAKETIQAVLEALSDLNCAVGGLGLEFSEEDGLIVADKKVSL